LRKECRLRVFENRVLRRIFGSKRDEVTGERRRLHNKELKEEIIGSLQMYFNNIPRSDPCLQSSAWY
jgi:hypothetical protein